MLHNHWSPEHRPRYELGVDGVSINYSWYEVYSWSYVWPV